MKNNLREWVFTVIIAIFISVIISRFLVFKIKIPSEPMSLTLNISDRLLVHRGYDLKILSMGDLIVFYY